MNRVNRNVSMYPTEWEIVRRYAQILQPSKPNISATLRIIVREWRMAEGCKLAEMEASREKEESTDE